MNDSILLLWLLILAACSFIGGILANNILRKHQSYKRYAILAEMFLMVLIVSELTKEGFAFTGWVIFSLLGGIGLLYLINKYIPHHHRHGHNKMSKLVYTGMLLHELPQGIAFVASFLIDPSLGIAIAILLALHNIPEGAVVSLPYFLKNKAKQAYKAIALTQLAFVKAGLTAYIILVYLSPIIQAHMMDIAAGMMIFIVIEEVLLFKR
ncbi:MAG: hypothetical protein V3V78_05405 [Candidatus Woesearchaeota archaeon]